MRIFLSFLILLFCVSCSLENNENVAMEDSASISFDTSWGKDVQTRGKEMVYHSIFKIGIFAKMKSDGDWQDGKSFDPSSSFMNNVNFFRSWVPEKKDWSDWDYTPHHYWPENENQKINFFAYAPRRDSASLNLANKHVRLYHSTSKENVDLVWACSLNQNKSTVSKSENKVQLQFKHSLAKISFKIGLSEPLDGDADKGAQVILKSVKLCANSDGTGGVFIDGGYLNLATGEWNLDAPLSPRTVYTWTPETDTNNKKDFLLSSDKINYENNPITVSDDSYLFILPQTKYQPFYLIVDYVLKHADGMEEQLQTRGLVNPKTSMDFVAGKAYNFVLNIPLNRIQVDVDTEVEGWTSTATKTRAEGTNTGISKFIDGSELGLFAFHAQNSTTTSKTLFMSKLNKTTEGEKLTYRASTWNYSPKRFWPQTGILYFYAGYPNAFTYENDGKVHFTSQGYNPFGVDFLWGLCNVECASHSNPWKIKMKHALARVNIYFEGYGDVDNVQVAACRKGTFTPTSTESIPTWNVDHSQENDLIDVKKDIVDKAAILFVFPGKINELSFYSSLKKETIDLPNFDTDSPEFEAGKEYNINVSPSGINYYYVPPK